MTDNIIANNCTGSRLYQQMGKQYGNPFMWCVISPEDFRYLYNHYHEINYNNYELTKKNGEYQIIIDGKVTIHYVHYKYGANDEVPTKKNNDMDIYYKNIEKYIIKKYESRLKRMVQSPFFIVSDREYILNKQYIFSEKELKYYVNRDNCIVATCNRNIVGNNVVYTPDKNIDPEEIARIILQNTKMIKYYNTEVVFEEIPDEVTLAVNITNCQHNCHGCHSSYLREDIGNELNFKAIDELIEKNDGITCFCFMGEGNDPKSLKDDILHIKEKYPSIKIGLYSGGNDVDDFYWDNLNYIKLGPYIEELGPLNKKTTNQRLYSEVNINKSIKVNEHWRSHWEDITEKFWK